MASNFAKPSSISISKGKFKGDGAAILMIFVGVLLAIVLLQPIADKEYESTNTITITNQTVTLPTTVGGTSELTGRDHVSTTAIVNASATDISANVTISDGLGSDGTKTVILTLDGYLIGTHEINGTSANITYVANPDGYVSGAGGVLLGLVILFGALAALVFVIVILWKKGSLGWLMRRN